MSIFDSLGINALTSSLHLTQDHICTAFLRGKCKFEDDKCSKRHCKEPYQWQQTRDIKVEETNWQDFPPLENDVIESSYCSQSNENLNQNLTIMFDMRPMEGLVNQTPVFVRRLSTASSVTKSDWEKAFCTEWIWYWLDETDTWNVYSEQNAKGITAGIDSATIEQKYLDYEYNQAPSKIAFTAGDQKYEMDFKAMQQINVRYHTCKAIRRRPKFVSIEEQRKEFESDEILNQNLTFMFEKSPMTASMNQRPVHVRRLSTASSFTKSLWEESFCTEWIWYWLDETYTWNVYSEQNGKNTKAGIDSATIEQKYLDYEYNQGLSKIYFTAGDQKYELDFKAMQQRNVHSHTCKAIRRTLKFVSIEEQTKEYARLAKGTNTVIDSSTTQGTSKINFTAVDQKYRPDTCEPVRRRPVDVKKTEEQGQESKGNVSQVQKVGVVPTTWDNTDIQADVKLVKITDFPEFLNVASLFWASMDEKATIVSIQRIQNLELWEDFTKMNERMKKRNGGNPVQQRQLFHGTQAEHTDDICHQNFDWRVSGSNKGTRYGKGSYFARDAGFASNFTKADANACCYIFIAQVLVGAMVKGNPSYVRPPSKDHSRHGGELYDSCVDETNNPKIFVIFEKTQVYPEYLITFKN